MQPPPTRRGYTRWLLWSRRPRCIVSQWRHQCCPKPVTSALSSLPNFRPAFVVSSLARSLSRVPGAPVGRSAAAGEAGVILLPGVSTSTGSHLTLRQRVTSCGALCPPHQSVPRRLAALTGGPPVSADTLMTAGYRHHPSTPPPPPLPLITMLSSRETTIPITFKFNIQM